LSLARKKDDETAIYESHDHKLGQILINQGLLSESQLQDALRLQEEFSTHKPIGQILIDQGTITRKQLNLILDRFKKRPRLGDILVRCGKITKELLIVALEYQKKTGVRLGDALVELNILTEEAMRQALCIELNIPFISFDEINVDSGLLKQINRTYAHKHRIVPIAKIGNTITLVMDDPTDEKLVEELQMSTGFSINVVTSTRAAIANVYKRLYEGTIETAPDIGVRLIEEDSYLQKKAASHLETKQIKRADTLVKQILAIGLKHSASDIHIENTERRVIIRFRIDGVLQQLHLGGLEEKLNRLRRELVSRIKVLGKLDISERRRPQDGRFFALVVKDGKEVKIDFRISIVSGYYGENVVLRVLDPRNAPKSVDHLGFSHKIKEELHRILKNKTGIFLVTGPTGCGKSTTLYGALMTAYQPGIKILTAEDPIEYIYDGITQCQVNTKIGNTFAKYVRAFLRQDPEIIMVGEIRDQETAQMAFRAAQTGHLVLSTLHTNDAISATTRLLELDVDSGLISSCLIGVLSQRLVRRICARCREECVPSKKTIKEFFDTPPPGMRWFKGQGCSECHHTGYSGRIAIAELWKPSEKDMILLNKGVGIDKLRKSSQKSTTFIMEDAMEKLRMGKINLEELLRVLPFTNIYQFRNLAKHF
jgi:type IV pilus assembly protein PilB